MHHAVIFSLDITRYVCIVEIQVHVFEFEFELITGQAAIADLSRGTAQVYNYKKIINND